MTRSRTTYLPLLAAAFALYCYFQSTLLQQTSVANHISQDAEKDRKLADLQKRIKSLETKLNTYMAFDSDPFLNNKITSFCKNTTNLREFCGKNGSSSCAAMGNMRLCYPDIPLNDCIVYDFGIREEPEFGVILSKPPFNCQVFAFDPSPITRTWFEKNKQIQQLSRYRLFQYGGGARDESAILREYDWGQVSVYQYPSSIVNGSDCFTGGPLKGKCNVTKFGRQKNNLLPVRSISSIMRELGHTQVDILKLDVEGSEYRMLETMITSGACQHIEQLTLEWHHFGWDIRYGHGSDQNLNVLHRLLKEECGLHQFSVHSPTGWPSNEKMFAEMRLPLYYNLASFRRQQR